jgi:hypothetical protein
MQHAATDRAAAERREAPDFWTSIRQPAGLQHREVAERARLELTGPLGTSTARPLRQLHRIRVSPVVKRGVRTDQVQLGSPVCGEGVNDGDRDGVVTCGKGETGEPDPSA